MFRDLNFKEFLLGKTLPTSAHADERLSNSTALAVLSSDALSSVAYATEEILLILVLAGSGALGYSMPIAFFIILLLTAVTLSYRQTIKAYPHGGGAYTVAHENLGVYPGLIAGASLMIDYTLTVTVSIAAGTAALTSAVPVLQPFTVGLCLIFTFLLMLANLRGVKESGNLFMVPTYAFIVSILVLIVWGLIKSLTGINVPNYPSIPIQQTLIGPFFLMKAFSAGCTALTGVEAISNGVLAFKAPEWKNARITLIWMSTILGIMFLGITYLSQTYHIVPHEGETVLSLLGRQIFGTGPIYYFLQIATLFILILAANTSYADFPRLSSLLARDGYLPRQLALLGERLVYSNGIILLSICASILTIIFKGDVSAIIPCF